jgi:hypothetical protein
VKAGLFLKNFGFCELIFALKKERSRKTAPFIFDFESC